MLIKSFVISFFLLVFLDTCFANEKVRIIITTDIGSGDPDDQQSMIRFLVYANEFDIEGIVAVTAGTSQGDKICDDLVHTQINAYNKVVANLSKHAADYPSAEYLHSIVKKGLLGRGMEVVGEGNDTEGTRWIIEKALREDARPLWITLWGGAATLAQALLDIRNSYDDIVVKQIISRLRVYAISDQDDAGIWIRREFPTLFYIVSPSRPQPDTGEYHRATWTGISGDEHFKIGLKAHFDMVSNDWIRKNISENHGILGELYPPSRFIMEGDTPSFLGLINNGLGWNISPDYGGWGGRYKLYQASSETRAIWTNNRQSRDYVITDNGLSETSDHATIWRWREHFQNDFAARMDWCIADSYEKANHNPIAVINNDSTKSVINIDAINGERVKLSSKGTYDPDPHQYVVKWWIYEEAGNVKNAMLTNSVGMETEVILPQGNYRGKLHIIMEVKDEGTPNLWTYRRVVIATGPN